MKTLSKTKEINKMAKTTKTKIEKTYNMLATG